LLTRQSKSAETFHGEIQKSLDVGRTRNVRSAKRHVLTQFFFEGFAFFIQQIAKNDSSAFLNETPDDACPYSSGATGNNSDFPV
jgi:hypothetical protein